MNKEKIKQQCDQLIQEYGQAHDYKEACRCVEELKGPDCRAQVVRSAIEIGLEAKEENLLLTLTLLEMMSTTTEGISQLICDKDFEIGVHEFFHWFIEEDFATDFPNAGSQIGKMLAYWIVKGCASLELLKNPIFDNLKQIGQAKLLVGSLIQELCIQKDAEEVLADWNTASLTLRNFVEDTDEKFQQKFPGVHDLLSSSE